MKSTIASAAYASVKDLLQRQEHRRAHGVFALEDVYLYVTMRCNAKCEHCFCWENLNVGIPELSLEQIEQLAESITPLRSLVLTGGEPMLRKDLLALMGAFARRDKVATIKINTNGLAPEKLATLATEFKASYPHVGLAIQLSLDGLEETHDRIRGVPGNFRKVIESFRRIDQLSDRIAGLHVGALTVVTAQNYKELLSLNDRLREEIGPHAAHGFELMRDVNRTAWNIPREIQEAGVSPKNMDPPPAEAFGEIVEAYRAILARSPHRFNTFHTHNLAQLTAVQTGREQIKCRTAGEAVGVIYSNGDVAACEFTRPFANLQQFNFDFSALWSSQAATERRSQIKRCHCIHGCYVGKSVEFSWKGLATTTLEALRPDLGRQKRR
jgi:MoaA/NifB/PqqE/SkfB family radical SAM enzyme